MQPGQQRIAEPGEQCCQRGKLFGRPEQAGVFRCGQGGARQHHGESHDDADMQPRHCEQMRQASGTEGVVIVNRHGVLEPRQQGDGERSGGAGDGGRNAPGDDLTQPLDQAERCAGRARRHQFGRPQRKAGAAEAGIKSVALQIPAARIGRRPGCPHQGSHAHHVAGAQDGTVVAAQADAQIPRLRYGAVVQPHCLQCYAPPLRQRLDRAHRA